MHWTGAWLLVAVMALGIALATWTLHRTRLGRLIHDNLRDTPRRRLFLASSSFAVTFAVTRALTYSIHHHIGPFHDIHMGGRHIHHLVWGILILLGVGYAWLMEVGSGESNRSRLLGQGLSLLYGAGAALTLDEFALWLNLEDVYWAREGRASLDAIVFFAALLAATLWGAPFIRALHKELWGAIKGGANKSSASKK